MQLPIDSWSPILPSSNTPLPPVSPSPSLLQSSMFRVDEWWLFLSLSLFTLLLIPLLSSVSLPLFSFLHSTLPFSSFDLSLFFLLDCLIPIEEQLKSLHTHSTPILPGQPLRLVTFECNSSMFVSVRLTENNVIGVSIIQVLPHFLSWFALFIPTWSSPFQWQKGDHFCSLLLCLFSLLPPSSLSLLPLLLSYLNIKSSSISSFILAYLFISLWTPSLITYQHPKSRQSRIVALSCYRPSLTVTK